MNEAIKCNEIETVMQVRGTGCKIKCDIMKGREKEREEVVQRKEQTNVQDKLNISINKRIN
jgi:hypothetical protein